MLSLLATLTAHAQDPASTDVAETEDPPVMMWAGRVGIFGRRKLPLIGHVSFRTDNFVLAEVVRRGEEYHLSQRVCKVTFEKTAGATVSLDETAFQGMPLAYPIFKPDPIQGGFTADTWPSGWDDKDRDGDGKPGITFRVKAPLCGGRLHFASHAESSAHGVTNEWGALRGTYQTMVDQKVLGAEGACLRLVTKGVRDLMGGYFNYVPVPADSTCDSLGDDVFPDPVPADK